MFAGGAGRPLLAWLSLGVAVSAVQLSCASAGAAGRALDGAGVLDRQNDDGPILSHLDLHVVLDRSASIAAADPFCRLSSGRSCWDEAAHYVRNITEALAPSVNGFAQDLDNEDGLRFDVRTFSCSEDSLPLAENITGPEMSCTNQALIGAYFILTEYQEPSGGTCPSLALSYVWSVMQSTPTQRKNKAVVLLSDGLTNKEDVEATREVAHTIEGSGARFYIVGIGSTSGWTDELVKEAFGPTASFLTVAAFSELFLSVDSLTASILNSFLGRSADRNSVDESSSVAPAAITLSLVAVGIAVGAIWMKRRREDHKFRWLSPQMRSPEAVSWDLDNAPPFED